MAQWSYKFAFTADVARIAQQRQLRQPAAQFDRDVPLGLVAVDRAVVAAESAVDGSQPPEAGVVETFDGADPEFEIGIDRILDQHRNVHAAQRSCQFLHGERIGRGAGTDPQQVDPRFERFEDVALGGHFGRDVHAGFGLDTLQPAQSFDPHSLESAGLGAGFPDAGAEDLHLLRGERAGGREHLLFGFGTARAGDYKRPPGRDAGKYDGLQIVHFHNLIGVFILEFNL